MVHFRQVDERMKESWQLENGGSTGESKKEAKEKQRGGDWPVSRAIFHRAFRRGRSKFVSAFVLTPSRFSAQTARKKREAKKISKEKENRLNRSKKRIKRRPRFFPGCSWSH